MQAVLLENEISQELASAVSEREEDAFACRPLIAPGIDRTELVYTAFGFEDDDAVMTERRLRLANLVGPAGFVSMEDGAAPGFVQRGAANADNALSIIEMGGSGFASGESRLSEAAVRGMWASYRQLMSL